jgi:hypothetical protein
MNPFFANTHFLNTCTDEIHFDSPTFFIVGSVVVKVIEIEISVQCFVNVVEDIQVEFGSDTLGIVVGSF